MPGTPEPKTSPFSEERRVRRKGQVSDSRSPVHKHLLARRSHLRRLANTTGRLHQQSPLPHTMGEATSPPASTKANKSKECDDFFFYWPQKVKFLSLRRHPSEKTNWALKVAGVLLGECGGVPSRTAQGCLQIKQVLCATQWFLPRPFPDMQMRAKKE